MKHVWRETTFLLQVCMNFCFISTRESALELNPKNEAMKRVYIGLS